MCVSSMTGFARAQVQSDNFELTLELKSVNNRYKDVRFKMGSVFSSKELELRKKIDQSFKRGSFELNIHYSRQEGVIEQKLDLKKIEETIEAFKLISKNTEAKFRFSPADFYKSEFFLDDTEKESALFQLLDKAVPEALEELRVSRQQEGLELTQKLNEHLSRYRENYEKVIPLKETYQKKISEKLTERLSDIKVDELLERRLSQEVIFYLEKLDIDEEINRIEIHLKKLDGLLKAGGEVGRQIDFLVQELNRETNTIGSKSGNGEISQHVVQMKVQLEKVREQALNLE